MKYPELVSRCLEWHRRKYGSDTTSNVERTFTKMVEEVGELAKAIIKGDGPNAQEEAGDVLIVLVHVCRGLGFDLLEAAGKKLEAIEAKLEAKLKSDQKQKPRKAG